MQRLRTFARATLVVAIVVSLTVGALPIVGTAAPQSQSPPAETVTDPNSGRSLSEATSPLAVSGTPDGTRLQVEANNSSARHRDPATVDDEDTLDELQRTLASRLVDRHERGSLLIVQGEYAAAGAIFDEEYDSLLEKYADVAEAQNDESVEETATQFRTAGRNQAQYAETVGEFEATYEAYLEARSSGNETRTRELARRVDRLGGWADENATQLRSTYTQLNDRTDADLSTASDRIQRVQASVAERRSQVGQSTFVRTELTLVEAESGGSFVSPMRIQLRLESQGEPVSNRPVTVEVGQQSYSAETDSEGLFAVEYRPRLLARNATTVHVQYVPQATSAYLGSETSVPITVEGTTATIEVADATGEAGFGDAVNVSGRVAVGDRPVPDVPLNVTVRGRTLGQVRTDENGSFALGTRLPSNVTEGETSIAVRLDVEDRAVDATPTVRPLTVTETDPQLSVSSRRQDGVVRVSGQLTAGGTAVEEQRIRIERGGETVATTETGTNGTFLVELADVERSGTAVVTFNGIGTNLAPASTEVVLPGPDPISSSSSTETGPSGFVPPETVELLTSVVLTQIGAIVGGIALVVVGLGFVAARRRRGSSQSARDSSQSSSTTADVTRSTTISAPKSLDAAAESLDAGDVEAAVLGAYAAARRGLRTTVSVDHPYTHRQFFDAGLTAGVDRRPLQTLTDTYEAVQYGQHPVSSEDAAAALAAARSLLDNVRSDADSGTD